MPRYLDPHSRPRNGAQESQGVLVGSGFKRLVGAPQTGTLPDGQFGDSLETQLGLAFDKTLALIAAAGLELKDLVRLVIHSKVAGAAELCLRQRDARIAPSRPAYAYREVAGFAHPDCLVEIEVEAVREA